LTNFCTFSFDLCGLLHNFVYSLFPCGLLGLGRSLSRRGSEFDLQFDLREKFFLGKELIPDGVVAKCEFNPQVSVRGTPRKPLYFTFRFLLEVLELYQRFELPQPKAIKRPPLAAR
jgi:hypothetical protein